MGKDLLSTLRWVRHSTTPAGLRGFEAPPMSPSTNPTARTIDNIGLPEVPSWPDGTPRTAKEEAVYLLRVAAQVEHGLLVQYLYAAYSIDNSNDPDDLQDALPDIAVQEMDHLLNVQHMLMMLGEPPYFDRPNFPVSDLKAAFYPYPFLFEPLSRGSLGKYVAAESPTDVLAPVDLSKLTDAERANLADAVADGAAAAGRKINHVGVLYAKLYWMFQADDTPVGPWKLPADKLAGTRHLQASDYPTIPSLTVREGKATEFQGQPGPEPVGAPTDHRVIWSILNAADARSAIAQIAEQGEGTEITGDSHFVEFLDLYGKFKAKAPSLFPVPTSPNLEALQGPASGKIDHPASAAWAQLFNRRYRMLLTELALVLSESAGENACGKNLASRGALIAQAIRVEMQGNYGVSGLAKRLTTMPRHPASDPKVEAAGATFEMLPDEHDLPTTPEGHRDFLASTIDEAARAIDALLALSGADALAAADLTGLAGLKAKDATLRADVVNMTFTP